jgi:hypothetical protein
VIQAAITGDIATFAEPLSELVPFLQAPLSSLSGNFCCGGGLAQWEDPTAISAIGLFAGARRSTVRADLWEWFRKRGYDGIIGLPVFHGTGSRRRRFDFWRYSAYFTRLGT